jgi:hypothetical protein
MYLMKYILSYQVNLLKLVEYYFILFVGANQYYCIKVTSKY